MSMYTERAFWKATAERAIKTAAQTAIALIGSDQVGILDLDWSQIGSVVATAMVLSGLTSVASGATGPGVSLTNSERLDVPTYGDWAGADVEVVEPEGDADPEGLADDEELPVVVYDVEGDADPEGLADDEAVAVTPPFEGYEPKH